MEEKKKLLIKVIFRIAMFPLFMGLIVLWPAGTFRFWEVYVFIGILMVPLCAAMVYFYRTDPEILEKRMKTKETQGAQKLFVALASTTIIATFVIPGFDHRFGWSVMPVWIIGLGDAAVLLSYLFVFTVIKTNSFASRVVEVTEDQKVISTGPYAVIRHPMYTGILLMYAASSIALSSWWGVIPAAVLLPVLVFRILNEEKLLREELTGYDEYCKQVRYRLVPFIW